MAAIPKLEEYREERQKFIDTKLLNTLLLKEKAARLGVKLKSKLRRNNSFIMGFNYVVQPHPNIDLSRPKPPVWVRAVNYILDPNNESLFSYDGRPPLSDYPSPSSIVTQDPKTVFESKDQLSLRLEMLDKELFAIRNQMLGSHIEKEDKEEIVEIITPIPINTGHKELPSQTGFWSSISNFYVFFHEKVDETESLRTMISNEPLSELMSKAAIYIDAKLNEGFLELTEYLLDTKEENKEKSTGFGIVYDLIIAANDDLDREISHFKYLLGTIEATMEEIDNSLYDISIETNVKIQSLLVMLSDESWNVLANKAAIDLSTELYKELSIIKRSIKNTLTTIYDFMITTNDELEASLIMLDNESWSELTNKAAISLDAELDNEFFTVMQYMKNTSMMTYDFCMKTNEELELSLAVINNESMKDIIYLNVELDKFVFYLKECILNRKEAKVSAEIAARNKWRKKELDSMIRDLLSPFVNTYNFAISTKSKLKAFWALINDESWIALIIKATIYLDAEADKKLSAIGNYLFGSSSDFLDSTSDNELTADEKYLIYTERLGGGGLRERNRRRQEERVAGVRRQSVGKEEN